MVFNWGHLHRQSIDNQETNKTKKIYSNFCAEKTKESCPISGGINIMHKVPVPEQASWGLPSVCSHWLMSHSFQSYLDMWIKVR